MDIGGWGVPFQYVSFKFAFILAHVNVLPIQKNFFNCKREEGQKIGNTKQYISRGYIHML